MAALVAVPLALVWGVYTVTEVFWKRTAGTAVERNAHDILDNIAAAALAHASDYLDEASAAADLTRRLIESDTISSATPEQMRSYLLDQLLTHTDFAGVYYAEPDGAFLYVGRDGESDGFLTKRISVKNGARRVQVHRYDGGGNETGSELAEDPFDPRERPWYRAAAASEDVVWNHPYVFYTSRMPGITLSCAARTPEGTVKWVVAVDIEIDELSAFLSTMKIGSSGKAFLFNAERQVVAYPDLSVLAHDAGNAEAPRLIQLAELGDPAIDAIIGSEAFTALTVAKGTAAQGQGTTFEVHGQRHLSLLAPLRHDDLVWYFGVYVPERDFVGPILTQHRRNRFVMLMVTLLASVVGLFGAQALARPLRALRDAAGRIEKRDFTSPQSVTSPYAEIQETAAAFERMREALLVYNADNARLLRDLQQSHLDTIYRLAACAEYKDEDTAAHLRRISDVACLIARGLGQSEYDVELLRCASPMHDLGKIGIPDEVLQKRGALSDGEWDVMRRHPSIGARILTPHETDLLRVAHDIALSHHEKWNGAGYPQGLAGEDIPIAARIVALADVLDALTHDRCYRTAIPFNEAVEIIRQGRSVHFDPACVDVFLTRIEDVKQMTGVVPPME